MRKISAILFLLLFAASVRAQTTPTSSSIITAASCSTANVQTAWNLLGTGTYTGTVVLVIPSGSCTWTAPISLAVPASVTNLTVQGDTNITCTGTAGTSTYSCTPTDNTIIVDSCQNSCPEGTPLITINTGRSTTSYFRFTGITVQGGSIGSTANAPLPWILFNGTSYNFRFDHNDLNMSTFTPLPAGLTGIREDGIFYGVIDHNYFVGNGNISGFSSAYNQDDKFGDVSWNTPSNWGTSQFLFFENNWQTNGAGITDCEAGGRLVIRYNTVLQVTAAAGSSNTEHNLGQGEQRFRACREEEIYHNYWSATTGVQAGTDVNNTSLVWGNTAVGNSIRTASAHVSRQDNAHAQGSLVSGVTNAPSGNWGYCGTAALIPGSGGVANGNGSSWDGNANTSTGYPCMDMVGRGKGDLLNGLGFPNTANSTTGCAPTLPVSSSCAGWPHELLEPAYLWMNTVSGSGSANSFVVNIGTAITLNQDVYFDCGSANSACSSGFTGTAGTGYGALSGAQPTGGVARPSTCTAGPGGTYGTSPTGSYGVAWWSTDTNTLYVCTSTNTWTAIYTPYTYPHPLTLGQSSIPSSSGPAAPTGLTATVE